MKELKIYFTSDLHGYVYPTDYTERSEKNIGLLNIINEFNKDGNTLIIDAGDTIQGSPFTNYLSSSEFDLHPIAAIMNAGGYDFITLGNHDFNYGKEYLKKYLNNLNATCLCANVIDTTGELPIVPYKIKTNVIYPKNKFVILFIFQGIYFHLILNNGHFSNFALYINILLIFFTLSYRNVLWKLTAINLK